MTLLFDESLKKIKLLFDLCGINLECQKGNTVKDKVKHRWLFIVSFIVVNIDVVSETCWVIDGVANGKELMEMTFIVPGIFLCILADLKALSLFFNEDILLNLIDNFREMEKKESGLENVDKDEIVREERKLLMVVITALNFWNWITVLAFLVLPFLLMGLKYQKTNEMELMLPFVVLYPFDPYDIKYWPFVYVHQCWSVTFSQIFKMTLLFDDSLKKIKLFFDLCGMNIKRQKGNTILDKVKYRWLFIFNFIWLNMDVAGEICWIIDGAANGKELVELTYIAPCTTLCILANVKALFLFFNEDKLFQLIENLREMEKKESGLENVDNDEIMREERKLLMVVITALNFWNWITVLAFLVVPFLLMGLQYKNTNEVELILPFVVVYPFDPYDIKYWPFVYVHQSWSATIVISEIVAADSLFYTCCSLIRAQFRILQHDFKGVFSLTEEAGFHEKFQKLVVRHQELIGSVNQLETIYTKSTLFNFVSSSFLICLTGFNVTARDDLAFILTFLSFLLMSLLQIYLLCFFGDMIMRSSMDVSNALYNSKWYLTKARTAKLIIIVQIRAQKPCKLTAASFADVNLRAFMRILSSSWSYFALLKTMNGTSRA